MISAFFYWLYKGRFDKRKLWGQEAAPKTAWSLKGKEDTEDELSDKENGELPAIAYKKNSPPQSLRSFGSSKTLPKVRRAMER